MKSQQQNIFILGSGAGTGSGSGAIIGPLDTVMTGVGLGSFVMVDAFLSAALTGLLE